MKKILKPIGIYLSLLLSIIILMMVSFLIPRKYIVDNSVESIKYMQRTFLNSRNDKKYPTFLQYDDGDVRYMEMTFLVDHNHPIKSTIEMNSYLSGDLNHLENGDYKYEQYARYWHAPVLYLRFIMLFMNIKTFMIIELIILIVVSTILFVELYKKNKCLSIAFLITYLAFSIFGVYKNISYFNCLIISMISSLIILKLLKKKQEGKIGYVFMISGLLTSLFDFLTLDVITLTLPLTIILLTNNKNQIKTFLKYTLIWYLSYIFPFLLKMLINYIYFGKNIIIDMFNRYKMEGFNPNDSINILAILKNNNKLILPFYYLKNYYYILLIIIIIFLYNFICYVDKKKYQCFIVILIITIIRILTYAIQATRFPFTTFRLLYPIYLFIIYIIIKQTSNIITKRQNNFDK